MKHLYTQPFGQGLGFTRHPPGPPQLTNTQSSPPWSWSSPRPPQHRSVKIRNPLDPAKAVFFRTDHVNGRDRPAFKGRGALASAPRFRKGATRRQVPSHEPLSLSTLGAGVGSPSGLHFSSFPCWQTELCGDSAWHPWVLGTSGSSAAPMAKPPATFTTASKRSP